MGDCKVIVPSRKRHDSIYTDIDNMILCVHKSEKEIYQEYNDRE